MTAALAGPRGDLLVEQSRRALIQDRPDLARDFAVESLRVDPDAWGAWRLYLRASKAAGLGAVAEAEVAGSDDPAAAVALAWWTVSTRRAGIDTLEPLAEADPRAAIALGWSLLADDRAADALALALPSDEPLAARLRLRALASRGRFDERDAEALAWLEAHPEHPDVVAELWGRGAAKTKAQKKARKVLAKRITAGESDPRWLLLVLRTLIAADDDELATVVADRIEEAGLPRPLTRNGWGPTMQKAMGRALSGHNPIVLPPTSDAERTGVATSLTDNLISRDRIGDAVRVWDHVRHEGDSWTAALGHGRALRASGDEDAAQAAFSEAMALTIAPWPSDPCALDLPQRAQAAAEIAHAAAGGQGDPTMPWPEPLTQALGGDFRGWRDQATDPMLRFCLSTATAAEMEPPADRFVSVERAHDALHSAYEAALALVPKDLAPATHRLPQPGEVFPDVPLAVGGEASTLADHRGSMVVLSLWASWCAPCRKELPVLDTTVAALREEGLTVAAFGLSIDGDERPYRRALQRLPLEHIALGRDPAVGKRLGVESLPALWVIDGEGKVAFVHVGYDPDLPERIAEVVRGGGSKE